VWGRHSHSRKWDLRALRDSQKFRVRLQGSKHLALRCSLYRWKGLEAYMSKMASHGPFGHLQQTLCAKEGPGVKLTIWLPTTKSRESTRPRCVQAECGTPLESSQGELQVSFKPHPDRRSEQGVMSCQSPGSPNRDSFGTVSLVGVPGQKVIWMWPPWSDAKYNIWGKVVASPESRPWWVKWVQNCMWLVLAPRVL
jgi:hypothetical protein